MDPRYRYVSIGYETTPDGPGLRWGYRANQSWSGLFPAPVAPRSNSIMEEIRMSIFQDTGRSPSAGATFSELVGLFDEAMASGMPIEVHASGSIYNTEVENPTGAFSAGTEVTGSFRVVAVQCRTPAGAMQRVRSAFHG